MDKLISFKAWLCHLQVVFDAYPVNTKIYSFFFASITYIKHHMIVTALMMALSLDNLALLMRFCAY